MFVLLGQCYALMVLITNFQNPSFKNIFSSILK